MNINIKDLKRFQVETNLFAAFSDNSNSIKMYDIEEIETNHLNMNDFHYLRISGWNKDDKYIYAGFSIPKKKEINFAYLMNKISKDSAKSYINLTNNFKKLIKDEYRFFPTSYGIAFDTFLLSESSIMQHTKELKNYLNSNNIIFRNEYSDAGWIYRFVISKSKENLDRINKL